MSDVAAWIREATRRRRERWLEEGREEGRRQGREEALREIYGADYLESSAESVRTEGNDGGSRPGTNGQ